MFLAKRLSAQYKVIAVARRIDKLRSEFKDFPNVRPYFLDLNDVNRIGGALEEIIRVEGDIFYVINNAGVMQPGSIEALKMEQMLQSIHVNGLAPMMVLKTLLPAMKKQNFGRIINITSGAPLNCSPEYGAYSASKSILNSLTITLGKELVSSNIKVNLMSPGPVQSEMAPNATLQPSICFPTVDYLLSLPEDGPTGQFFWLGYEVPLFPDLEGVDWLGGVGNEKLRKIQDIKDD
ncbi:MAG: SDR family NAD(P)-dependent oxidoreductase [Candidatus Nitrohelix vancouverensis]|uniref:SDR family NAD(P)-dependent oxidoreductase n=1 Tax=Candidatus Nitrohelix vancouverensis TaxID=2705534 RepID=A0A7T0C037_9BACT|nr:MAG: SDR family NAD(P)-dependent oxidoreductase [Candidatus Nitrohelix vancouverensis]